MSKNKAIVLGMVITLLAGIVLLVPPMVLLMMSATMVPAVVDRCDNTGQVPSAGQLASMGGYTVMSFNVRTASMSAPAEMKAHQDDYSWSKRGPAAIQYVLANNPDVVGFQEMSKDKNGTKQISGFMGIPGYTWAFTATAMPIAYRTSAFTEVGEGTIQLSWKGKDGANGNRYARWLRLRPTSGDSDFIFINVHAQFGQTAADANARSKGWDKLIAGITQINPGSKLPMIMVGDFNSRSDETKKVYKDHLTKLAGAGWQDAASIAPIKIEQVPHPASWEGWGVGINGKFYYKAIRQTGGGWHYDYVWTHGAVQPMSWQIYLGPQIEWRKISGTRRPFATGIIPSDHWPVLSRVSLSSTPTITPLSLTGSTIPSASVKVDGYTASQMQIAGQIVAAGKRMGLDNWTLTVGVMTGIGESALRNIDYGDKAGPDSRGVFQQRDNGAWGSLADRMNPATAATNFFKALIEVPDYHSLAPTIAAHRTQHNADPYHYEKYWQDAVEIVAAITGDPDAVPLALTGGGQPECNQTVMDAYTGDMPPFPTDCPPTGSAAEDGLQPNTLHMMRCVKAAFPQITSMGGKGARPNKSDHPTGRAVDFMIPKWKTTEGNAFGWQVAEWVKANANTLDVKYIIFDQKIWSPGDKTWDAYTFYTLAKDGPTKAHLDHVHVSVN